MSTTTKTRWAIDLAHSEVGFKVKHMMITNVSGKFVKFDASIETEEDTFENSHIEFTGQVDSLTTGNADRDVHLLSPDFFDAAAYPKIKFVSTSIKKIDWNTFELYGDLSMHGVSKFIKLDVEYSGKMLDPWGNEKLGMTVMAKLNRKDWGLNWNTALEAGGVLVGDEIRLDIGLQFIKQ